MNLTEIFSTLSARNLKICIPLNLVMVYLGQNNNYLKCLPLQIILFPCLITYKYLTDNCKVS